jgi:hypothetical protein
VVDWRGDTETGGWASERESEREEKRERAREIEIV